MHFVHPLEFVDSGVVEVPGAVESPQDFLLPIPVTHPLNKKDSAYLPSHFCSGGAGNRTRVLR